MDFIYDKQTFLDLEILKDFQATSVYQVFDKTLTEGGSMYLKELMRTPIADHGELASRTRLIQYLITKDLDLSINSRQLKFIERYTELSITVLKNNPLDLYYYQFNEWLRPSNDYYLLKSGCFNLILVLHELNEKIAFDNIPTELDQKTKTLQEIIRELKGILDANPKMSWRKTIRYDRIFRKRFVKKLRPLLQEIYFIDALIAIAKAAKENSFTVPQYDASLKPLLVAAGLKHPLIENAVPYDMEFQSGENMCFLTGANMAGKSTFLKSIGIAIYLAHLGFPVPSKKFKTTIYTGLITTIHLADNTSFGYSHFYAEVNRVKDAALALSEGNRMFVIFDELFRGTNVKDALDASTEIIKGFAEIDECTFFMSTHIVEIAEAIKDRSNICFKYFDSEMEDGNLKYSYELKDGVSNERLGMYIVRREGIFDLLRSIKKEQG